MTFASLALLALAAASLVLPAGPLPSAVYPAPPAARPGRRPTTQVVLQGRTLDLRELTVTTTTLPAGQAGRLPAGPAEMLLIVQAGHLAATLPDTTQTLGPGGVVLALPGDQPRLRNATTEPVRYWVLQFSAAAGADAARGRAAGNSLGRDWASYPVVRTEKGETRPVFDRPSAMFARFDVHATVLKPGLASHPPHTHRTEEIVLMTQGRGQMQIGNQTYPAAAGDVILLRANVPHAFTNNSAAPCGYFAIQWHGPAEQAASPAR